MKEEFTPGAVVHWNIPHGANARILRYVGEGYYEVETIPDRRRLFANEDELVLGLRGVNQE